MVKVGLASQLEPRLDQYLACYPRGFALFGLVRFRAARQGNIAVLERAVHTFLRQRNRSVLRPHGHSKEWFLMSPQEMQALLTTLGQLEPLEVRNRALDPQYVAHCSKKIYRTRAHDESLQWTGLLDDIVRALPGLSLRTLTPGPPRDRRGEPSVPGLASAPSPSPTKATATPKRLFHSEP